MTKAATKGTDRLKGLACFLLFSAFADVVHAQSGLPFGTIDFAVPEVCVGGLFGGMLVFTFSGMACQAVGVCAQDVVTEVRRQFALGGIMEGTRKPDYSACVSIVAAAALKEMRKPAALALCLPVSVGFIFRVVGSFQGKPLLGPMVLAGLLMVATITGIRLSLFLNTAGARGTTRRSTSRPGCSAARGRRRTRRR